MAIKRAYRMRAYPTRQQQSRATELLKVHCELYNAALQERRDAWRMNGVSVSYGVQSAQLSAIRQVRPDVAEFSFTAQQQTLRRLRRSFDGFFRRVKAGQAPGFPRFRSYSRFDTVDHVNGDGARWQPTVNVGGKWARAYFQGVGHLKVDEHTAVTGRVTQVSLKRENGGRRWYVVVTAEQEPVALPATGREIGVDVGINRFATISDGDVVANPKWLGAAADDLADLQRRAARCKPGSRNRRRLKRQVAKLHRQVANRRRDHHHKTARSLIDTSDVIAVEDLHVANLTRRAIPKPDPDRPGQWLPNGAAAKTGLNCSMNDAGWSQFIAILTAKAASAGRKIIAVNPAFTSINCHICDERCTRPQQSTVICATHGPIDADINAARNIATRAGLGSGQAHA